MVDFSNRDEVQSWLGAIKPEQRQREVAVALAARAALRVLPLLARELARGRRKRGEILSALVLPCLRATALPWAAGKYPAHGNDLRAANAAANAAAAAANAAANANDAANAAAAAANAAANAAYAAAYAATAADAADDAAYEATYEANDDAAAAAADDAAVIDSGGSGALLAGTALWPTGAPSWATNAWRDLKSALLAANEGWEVWTDWYEARLAGDAADPPNEALEVARAMIPDEIWKQGPAAVNAEIKRLIDKFASPKEQPSQTLGDDAVDFSNPVEVKRWLDSIKPARRRREVATALAARAALRPLPLLAAELKRKPRGQAGIRSSFILETFRSAATVWAAAKFNARVKDLQRVAGEAADAVLSTNTELAIPDGFTGDIVTAAAFAAVTVRAASGVTEAAAIAAARSAAAFGDNIFDATSLLEVKKVLQFNASVAAASSDASAIGNGLSGPELAGSALWPRRAPNRVTGAWQELKAALLAANEGWEAWIDWYEARLAGDAAHPPNEALEVARATISDEVWKQGPVAVNTEIKRLINEHDRGPRPAENQDSGNDAISESDVPSENFTSILGTRSALRVLPLLVTDRQRIGDRNKSRFILAIFRALAVAWANAQYSSIVTRESCRAAARGVKIYALGSGPAVLHIAEAVTNAAYSAGSTGQKVAAGRAARAHLQAKEAGRTATGDRSLRVILDRANSEDGGDILAGGRPTQVAAKELWPGRDLPPVLGQQWKELKDALQFANEGWEVWIDWYEARLHGHVRSQEVELAYVEFTRSVPSAATAWDVNSEIKRLIDAATPRSEPPSAHWKFFVSYAKEDERSAREVVGILESAGHSTVAQFKDFPVGANFVNEMNRGLAETGRFIALYSPNYQTSEHCQAEWAAAYNADPSGARRKLVAFLLSPTALTPLARQIVRRSLVGLSEAQRKAAVLEAIAPVRTPSRNEIKEKLAEVASPQATINAREQLDAGPNATFDRPFVDADLPELPSVQRALANALRESLPRNAPPIVGTSLRHYRDHLLERGTQPIVRELDDFAAAVSTECEGPESSNWKSAGLAELFKRFLANHAFLRTHFPLKGEALFAEIPIDEEKAVGPILSNPIKEVAAAMQDVAAIDKATRAIANAAAGSAAFANDLASLPRPQNPVDPKSAHVSVKRRYVLGTIGFLVTVRDSVATTPSISDTPEGQALLVAVTDAIKELMSLLL
jgi:hypothetical protein